MEQLNLTLNGTAYKIEAVQTSDPVEDENEKLDMLGLVRFNFGSTSGCIEKKPRQDGRHYGVTDHGDPFSLILEAPKGYEKRITPDQCAVIKLIKDEGPLTLARAVEFFGGHIYRNAEKHIGARLSRMVKRGLIARAAKGVFIMPPIVLTLGQQTKTK